MEKRDFSDDEIHRLVKSMDSEGYSVIPDYLSTDEIEDAARFVVAKAAEHGGEYFSSNGPDSVAGTVLADLGRSSTFRSLLARVYESAVGELAPPDDIFQALRVLQGQTGLKKAWKFHYDSYVITALIPIIIPSDPGTSHGDLIIYPRLRRVRRSAAINTMDRIAFQNGIARSIMANARTRRLLKAKTVRMHPGNIYFFRGYESLHANEPCAPDAIRCTALFHFADPHQQSGIYRAVKERRELRRNQS